MSKSRTGLPEEEQELIREYERRYYKDIRSKCPSYITKRKEYYEANKESFNRRAMKSKFKSRFNITLEYYWDLFNKQNGLCALCNEPEPLGILLSVDHCHKTGKIRGLLCGHCNRGLGLFRDNPEVLIKAAEYVS